MIRSKPNFAVWISFPERVEKPDGFRVSHPAEASLRGEDDSAGQHQQQVPPTTFNSNNHVDATPGGGMAERTIAIAETMAPVAARPALAELHAGREDVNEWDQSHDHRHVHHDLVSGAQILAQLRHEQEDAGENALRQN